MFITRIDCFIYRKGEIDKSAWLSILLTLTSHFQANITRKTIIFYYFFVL